MQEIQQKQPGSARNTLEMTLCSFARAREYHVAAGLQHLAAASSVCVLQSAPKCESE